MWASADGRRWYWVAGTSEGIEHPYQVSRNIQGFPAYADSFSCQVTLQPTTTRCSTRPTYFAQAALMKQRLAALSHSTALFPLLCVCWLAADRITTTSSTGLADTRADKFSPVVRQARLTALTSYRTIPSEQ